MVSTAGIPTNELASSTGNPADDDRKEDLNIAPSNIPNIEVKYKDLLK